MQITNTFCTSILYIQCIIKELFLSRYQKGNIQYELYRYSKTDGSLTVVAGLDNNVGPLAQQQLKN
jgi:hypothetical protein